MAVSMISTHAIQAASSTRFLVAFLCAAVLLVEGYDIAAVGYPDVAYFIISHIADEHPQVRAFSIRDGQISELNLHAP